MMTNTPCPCGLGAYETCCTPFIAGTTIPDTPERLMRSRYTAFTEANIDYIVATQAGPAAEGFDPPNAAIWAKSVHWDGLKVRESRLDGERGYVHFEAHYREDRRKAYVIEELSEFRRVDGRWVYWASLPLPGHTPVNQGRNAPCQCGSGKKYKRCCGKAE